MSANSVSRPVVLCVLDGWGWRLEQTENAIALAETPIFNRMIKECPNALLKTSGIDVGLPVGQMGNSEVGHMNLGAGRVVNQDIQRINKALKEGKLRYNPIVEKLISHGSTCHLMGLLSPGGVHSHQDQILELANILNDAGVKVAIHAFLDGRDTPPKSALQFLTDFCEKISQFDSVSIATVTGRFYAMDRDNRWNRVKKAYDAIVSGEGEQAKTPIDAIRKGYNDNLSDEFILPTIIDHYDGMMDGDTLLMANFRSDRAREILTALLEPDFIHFKRSKTVSISCATGLVQYSETLDHLMSSIFLPERLDNLFAQVISDAGLKQFRIAETEKYAHVTFFFNGGNETPFPGEERLLIPSPKVETYDLQPEMAAPKVTDCLLEAVTSGKYDFIFVNFANPDMVGHTGVLSAAIKAIETVDTCMGRLEKAALEVDATLLITADHGNAETMTDPDSGKPFTSHTTNKVPLILVNASSDITNLKDGKLADVAPTLIQLLGLSKPREMTGQSLLETTECITSRRDSNPCTANG